MMTYNNFEKKLNKCQELKSSAEAKAATCDFMLSFECLAVDETSETYFWDKNHSPLFKAFNII